MSARRRRAGGGAARGAAQRPQRGPAKKKARAPCRSAPARGHTHPASPSRPPRYDHDGGLALLERRATKDARRRGDAAPAAAARDKARQVADFRRGEAAAARCALCFTSPARQRHLLIAAGDRAYLALPARGRLAPGHAVIALAEHAGSAREADEAAWEEVRNFKKCLIRMYAARGLEAVFVETAPRPRDARAHAAVECVPLPPAAAARAPLVFRKAVDDATDDWATHAAKRCVDTSSKGLRGAIPPGFPYMSVEFGLSSGFVHVIDDPATFDVGLARGVLAGLLGLPAEDARARARGGGEGAAAQAAWAAELRAEFAPYDWTRQLDG